jgi:BioD-like phosphotransacetylase family protein
MKALYVTSVEPYSGKTAVCLALCKKFQELGLQVGYLKPMSTQSWRAADGSLGDEDTAFVQATLGLELVQSPVIVTHETLRQRLSGESKEDLLEKVVASAEKASANKDILFLEGGASLRDGYVMGVSNLQVAEKLGAPAVVIMRYHGEMQVMDDALAAHFRLGDLLLGIIINHVPKESVEFIKEYAEPNLQKRGIRLLGFLPSVPRLSALSIGELHDLLGAEVLTEAYQADALAESFTVGAMTLDAALSRFRRQQNKAVITGGDRSDIQLAALETSTVVLILTGNLRPSPIVLQQAESLQVPVLLVPHNTMETVDLIEGAYGKTRLGQPEKFETFLALLDEHVEIEGIANTLDLL